MGGWLGKTVDPLYAFMRAVVGLLFACHGAQKLFGVLGGQVETGDPQGLVAGIVEFGGGTLVALGLFTTVAAFVSSGEMAVAYFKAHAPRGFWPISNGGEKAVFYCFVFLFIAARGSSLFSLDRLRKRSGGPCWAGGRQAKAPKLKE